VRPTDGAPFLPAARDRSCFWGESTRDIIEALARSSVIEYRQNLHLVDEADMAHVRTLPGSVSQLQRSLANVGSLRFRVVDLILELRTNLQAVHDVMDHLLAPFTYSGSNTPDVVYSVRESERPADRRRYELLKDGDRVGRVSSIGLLVDLFVRTTTSEVVSTTRFVAIHAAAAARDGRAVLMPASPGSGKSTTVAALVGRGWDLLTDEAALISVTDGSVHPFPRPLSISRSSMELLPDLRERMPAMTASYGHYDHHVAPDDLRPGCVSGPVPIGGIIFPAYAPGAVTELTPIPRAEALVDVLKRAFNLDIIERDGVETLGTIIEGVPCSRLRFGSLGSAVDAIERSLAKSRPVVNTVQRVR
jgi:hypothetical protein